MMRACCRQYGHAAVTQRTLQLLSINRNDCSLSAIHFNNVIQSILQPFTVIFKRHRIASRGHVISGAAETGAS